MRIHAKDTAALLNESRQADRQIYSWIGGAIGGITTERDLIIEDVVREGFNIRQKVLSVMRSYETPIKERLFEISGKSEALLRGMYERRDIVFESDAKQFFESSLSEAAARFSEWRAISEANSYINRRFIEWKTRRRRGGGYSRSERSHYSRRSKGESIKKLIEYKQKLVMRRSEEALSKAFEDGIKDAIEKNKEWIEEPEIKKYLEPIATPYVFAIRNKTPAQLRVGPSRHIVLADDGQALDYIATEAPYE